jgi:hypothetical protein
VNEDLDKTLRKALRPVDPGEEFTARVLARAAEEGARGAAGAPPSARKVPRFIWVPAALAASLALVVVGAHVWRERQEEAGLAARDQVMEALRVTSEKLDLAYEIVNRPAPPPGEDGSGA